MDLFDTKLRLGLSRKQSVRIIFYLPANNRKIASFTVQRSFSRLHNMTKDGMSKKGRRMSLLQVTLKAIVKIACKFERRKHVPVEVVLLILVIDPYYFYHNIFSFAVKKGKISSDLRNARAQFTLP